MKPRSAISLFAALAIQTLCLTPAYAQTTAAAVAAPPAAVQPTPPPAPPVDPHARYNGTYAFVGGDRERQALDAAVETTIDGMNFIARPIARGRLHDRNPVYNAVGIRLTPGFIEVLYDGRSYRSPDNGANASGRTVTGDAAQISHRFDGNGRLTQAITTDSGVRRVDFNLSGDGNTLSMNVTVSSSSLPRALHYSFTFRRRS
jgi:hypothetical protein